MPLTILTVCTSRAWGGMEMSMVQTCANLRARGHAVVPVCGPLTVTDERLRGHGFAPVTANLWSKVHPHQAWRLSRLMRDRGVQVVHCDWSRDLFTLVPALPPGAAGAAGFAQARGSDPPEDPAGPLPGSTGGWTTWSPSARSSGAISWPCIRGSRTGSP